MTDASSDDARPALESLLRWYDAMGVDAAIDDRPHDRFASEAPAPRVAEAARPPIVRPAIPQVSAPAETLVREAEARAAAAPDLEALQAGFETLPGCGLATSARMILAEGTAGCPLMIVGGAPDSDDEREGRIFAGASGQLLDAMLRAIGLDRSHVYLANVVPWRPPGNRQPTPLELSLCLPLTRRHVELAGPRVILCLGEQAAQPLLGTREPINRLRGRWLSYEGNATTIKLLATFSPAYLLSQPLQKRRAWSDLQMVMSELAR